MYLLNIYSYFIGDRIDELNSKKKVLRLPNAIRRNFRSLSDRDYFHVHEWKFILLFVAVPLLKDILPERYSINHVNFIIFQPL